MPAVLMGWKRIETSAFDKVEDKEKVFLVDKGVELIASPFGKGESRGI